MRCSHDEAVSLLNNWMDGGSSMRFLYTASEGRVVISFFGTIVDVSKNSVRVTVAEQAEAEAWLSLREAIFDFGGKREAPEESKEFAGGVEAMLSVAFVDRSAFAFAELRR